MKKLILILFVLLSINLFAQNRLVSGNDILTYNGDILTKSTITPPAPIPNKLFWNFVETQSPYVFGKIPKWNPTDDFSIVVKGYFPTNAATTYYGTIVSNLCLPGGGWSGYYGWNVWLRTAAVRRLYFVSPNGDNTAFVSENSSATSWNFDTWSTMIWRYDYSEQKIYYDTPTFDDQDNVDYQISYRAEQDSTFLFSYYIYSTGLGSGGFAGGGIDWVAIYDEWLPEDTVDRFISQDTFNVSLVSFYDAYTFDLDTVGKILHSYLGTHNGKWYNGDDTTIIKLDSLYEWGIISP